MDVATIRALNETHRATRRGVRLKAVKVRLPETIRVRLIAASERTGLTQTEYVVAGLAAVLPEVVT
jgi:predicted DNA-binding protein